MSSYSNPLPSVPLRRGIAVGILGQLRRAPRFVAPNAVRRPVHLGNLSHRWQLRPTGQDWLYLSLTFLYNACWLLLLLLVYSQIFLFTRFSPHTLAESQCTVIFFLLILAFVFYECLVDFQFLFLCCFIFLMFYSCFIQILSKFVNTLCLGTIHHAPKSMQRYSSIQLTSLAQTQRN